MTAVDLLLSTQRKHISAKEASAKSLKVDLSIHPRNWPPAVQSALGWTEVRKRNTSRAPSPKTKQKAAAGIERHLAAHPHDSASRAHLAALVA